MTVIRTLRAVGMVAVLGLIPIGFAGPALAAESTPPAAVTSWFAEQAPQTAAGVLGSGAVEVGEVGAAAEPVTGVYSAGAPVRLHDWNPGFVAGDSDTAVVETGEWVAPLYRDGAVAGTIAATLSADGSVTMSYVDDDTTAGTALASGAVAGDVVQDPQLGGLVEVEGGGEADGLSEVAGATVDTAEVEELRDLVTEAHDPVSWAPDEAGSGSEGAGAAQGSVLNDGQAQIGLLIVAAALVLWFLSPRRTRR